MRGLKILLLAYEPDYNNLAEQIVFMNEFDVEGSWKKIKKRYPSPPKRWWQRPYEIAASVIRRLIKKS